GVAAAVDLVDGRAALAAEAHRAAGDAQERNEVRAGRLLAVCAVAEAGIERLPRCFVAQCAAQAATGETYSRVIHRPTPGSTASAAAPSSFGGRDDLDLDQHLWPDELADDLQHEGRAHVPENLAADLGIGGNVARIG